MCIRVYGLNLSSTAFDSLLSSSMPLTHDEYVEPVSLDARTKGWKYGCMCGSVDAKWGCAQWRRSREGMNEYADCRLISPISGVKA